MGEGQARHHGGGYEFGVIDAGGHGGDGVEHARLAEADEADDDDLDRIGQERTCCEVVCPAGHALNCITRRQPCVRTCTKTVFHSRSKVSPANVICFGISGSGISLSRCLVYYVLRSEMALERPQACFGGAAA